MPTRTDPFRLLRSAVATAVILALAVGAHAAGGGTLPAPALLLGLAAFTLAGVSVTAGRRFRPGSLFLVLGAAQLVLHQAFDLLTPVGPVPCLPAASGHGSHGAAAGCLPAAAAVLPGPAGHEHAGSGLHDAGAALFLAHLAAVVLTTLALARGEDALHAAAAWLRPLFSIPAPLPFRTARPAAISGPDAGTLRPPFCSARPLRGPPSYALV